MVEVFDDQVGEVGRMLADWLIGQGVDPLADESIVVSKKHLTEGREGLRT